MNRFRRLTIAVSLSLALVSVPAMALATTRVTYFISGVELPGATDTVGSFAGVAFAFAPFDYGTWQATIVHDATTIYATDGTTTSSFALDGKVRDVQGVFTGGSLTKTGGFIGDCPKETFTVVGALALDGGGTGWFSATLTHYRKVLSVVGCTTYFATVRGSVTFSFPSS